MRARADDSGAFCDPAETEQTREARIGEKKTNGTTGMKAILGCAALAFAVTAAPLMARPPTAVLIAVKKLEVRMLPGTGGLAVSWPANT